MRFLRKPGLDGQPAFADPVLHIPQGLTQQAPKIQFLQCHRQVSAGAPGQIKQVRYNFLEPLRFVCQYPYVFPGLFPQLFLPAEKIHVTDQGGKGIKPLSGSGTFKLRHPRVLSDRLEVQKGLQQLKYEGSNVLQIAEGENIFIERQMDLYAIQTILLELEGIDNETKGMVEVRQGRVDGSVLFQAEYKIGAKQKSDLLLKTASTPKTGKHDLYFILKSDKSGPMLKALRFVPE